MSRRKQREDECREARRGRKRRQETRCACWTRRPADDDGPHVCARPPFSGSAAAPTRKRNWTAVEVAEFDRLVEQLGGLWGATPSVIAAAIGVPNGGAEYRRIARRLQTSQDAARKAAMAGQGAQTFSLKQRMLQLQSDR